MVIYDIITGERPSRPPGSDERLSDDTWSFISNCWSASWNDRPSVNFALNALNDAADVAEVGHRGSYGTTSDQEERIHIPSRRYTTNGGRHLLASNTLPLRGDSIGEEVEGWPFTPQDTQRVQTSAIPETSTALLESWEVDLVAFLDTNKTVTEAELEGKKAQEFADKLDAVRFYGKQADPVSEYESRPLTGKTSRKENGSSI